MLFALLIRLRLIFSGIVGNENYAVASQGTLQLQFLRLITLYAILCIFTIEHVIL